MSYDPQHQEKYILIWSKAVDTQMHFNEMSVKSRQLGLTFVAAALGLGVVLLSRGNEIAFLWNICSYRIHIHGAVLLVLGALLALRAVRQLDLRVYHRMLRGAVAFGEDLEEHYLKKLVELEKGMTQAISHFSRHDDASVDRSTGKIQYKGKSEITAEKKISRFYTMTSWSLVAIALFLFVITNLAEPGAEARSPTDHSAAISNSGDRVTQRAPQMNEEAEPTSANEE